MFHASQSIYLEFGTVARYDFVVVGSNKGLLPGRTRKEMLSQEPGRESLTFVST